MTVDKINKLWHTYTLEHFMGRKNQWNVIGINKKDFEKQILSNRGLQYDFIGFKFKNRQTKHTLFKDTSKCSKNIKKSKAVISTQLRVETIFRNKGKGGKWENLQAGDFKVSCNVLFLRLGGAWVHSAPFLWVFTGCCFVFNTALCFWSLYLYHISQRK